MPWDLDLKDFPYHVEIYDKLSSTIEVLLKLIVQSPDTGSLNFRTQLAGLPLSFFCSQFRWQLLSHLFCIDKPSMEYCFIYSMLNLWDLRPTDCFEMIPLHFFPTCPHPPFFSITPKCLHFTPKCHCSENLAPPHKFACFFSESDGMFLL